MYARFTDRARRVLQLANNEAMRFNHEYIGTEHILLGLVKEGTGLAAKVLSHFGIDLRTVRVEVEKIVQAGPDVVTMGKIPQTPRTKKVLEYAIEEAGKLHHDYVGTEHLLLGLLREEEGVGAQVLENLGLKLTDVRAALLTMLDQPGAELPPAAQQAITPKPPVVPASKTRPGYERFTDRARKVMQLANEEAQRFRHDYIGTEHLLTALVREGSGVAANVLQNLGLELRKLRLEVEKIVQTGEKDVAPKLPLTPKVKVIIDHAIEEARGLNHNYVGTEHLLLGLLREQESVAAQVIVNLGLSLARVRQEVLQVLGLPPSEAITAVPLETNTIFEMLPTTISRTVTVTERLIDLLGALKERAVAAQDFEWAAEIRDRSDKLLGLKEWLQRNKDRDRPPPPDAGEEPRTQ